MMNSEQKIGQDFRVNMSRLVTLHKSNQLCSTVANLVL